MFNEPGLIFWRSMEQNEKSKQNKTKQFSLFLYPDQAQNT